jgi:hypothetical protein
MSEKKMKGRTAMKVRTRFIKSVIETARKNERTAMPWARGAHRRTHLAKRHALAPRAA